MPPIEKVRVPVRLGLPHLPPREGWLALRSDTEQGRPETVLELLNHRVSVLPFIEPDESVVLLTRRNIDWVVTAPAVEEHFIAPSHRSITRKQRVALSLHGSREDRGDVEPRDPSDYSQPEHALQQAEEERRIQQALNRLSSEHRAVLIMKDMEGQKYETMAEVLQVPIGTIRSRLHRARLELRDILLNEDNRAGKNP